ncbi:MAG: hypothetical protein AAB583_05315 [Patescibacteria group bacterium]
MGKIRVRTLGIDEAEKKQKEQARKKAESKKLVKGQKGGERIVAVGPSEEELAKLDSTVIATPSETRGKQSQTQGIAASPSTNAQDSRNDKVRKVQKKKKERVRSKSYQTVAKVVDRSKKYSLTDALELLEKLKRSKFDETVELHINTIEPGISGTTVLPHGTGKTFRVAIANDDIVSEVQKGKIDFDMLLAAPQMMPKLAKVAKFLGPRGLMPNPKNGTLTKDPEKLKASFKKGQVNFKTEAKFPIMHLSVGKISFGAKKLSENIESILEAIKKEKIRNVTLKSTMSPGINLAL